MMIYLPYAKAIDIDDPPVDLKELVEESFYQFHKRSYSTLLHDKIEYIEKLKIELLKENCGIDECYSLIDFLEQEDSEENALETVFLIIKTVVNYIG